MRAQSTSAVWEAARKAREAARKLSALPNEDRNDALERMAKALENGKADIEKANALDCEKAAKPEANVAAPLQARLKFGGAKLRDTITGVRDLKGLGTPSEPRLCRACIGFVRARYTRYYTATRGSLSCGCLCLWLHPHSLARPTLNRHPQSPKRSAHFPRSRSFAFLSWPKSTQRRPELQPLSNNSCLSRLARLRAQIETTPKEKLTSVPAVSRSDRARATAPRIGAWPNDEAHHGTAWRSGNYFRSAPRRGSPDRLAWREVRQWRLAQVRSRGR